MFETLTRGFRAARNKLQGKVELTEELIDDALRDIRVSLLEADVQLDVTKRFLGRVKDKAVGEIVKTKAEVRGKKVKLSPTDHFVKICQDELEAIMGPVDTAIARAPRGTPTGVMVVGLQGSGKTTTAAKLARHLEKQGWRPLLVAADVYRPAAIEQLKVLGEQLAIPVYAEDTQSNPVDICKRAMSDARSKRRDLVIFDTAGRLAIDEPLMRELGNIQKEVKPKNVFLVVDAMVGQDAVRTAKAFHERLELSGVILTKLDGDARGGAALAVKEVTGAPIKYLGVGEALDKLEEFRPEGLASRILGHGDVVGLMKDLEDVIDDEQKAEEDAQRMLRGHFSLEDFYEQIKMLQKMGSLTELFDKMPFFPDGLPEGVKLDESELVKIKAMIGSMTRGERARPEVFDREPSRVDRVARGSGRKAAEVKELLGKFTWMRDMMGNIGQQAGMLGRIPGMKQLAMARKLRDVVKLQGMGGAPGHPMAGIADTMLEAAVAAGQGGGGFPGMPGFPGLPPARGGQQKSASDKSKRKSKRQQQKKARKKARRR
jgi:signal recognition particle subunit SRP54